MLSAYFSGLGIGASLVIAIGAQNAFVLLQAIRNNRPLLVSFLSGLLDVMLIFIGVAGVGTIIAQNALLQFAAGAGGCIFLILFGIKSVKNMRNAGKLILTEKQQTPTSLGKTLAATLAVCFLNPHVYLDTIIMLGSISASFEGSNRYFFGAGASTASMVWFLSLAFFGKLLAPLFAGKRSWQILYGIVAIMVWSVAVLLFKSAVATFPAAASTFERMFF